MTGVLVEVVGGVPPVPYQLIGGRLRVLLDELVRDGAGPFDPLVVAVSGVLYGYTGARLSFAAEKWVELSDLRTLVRVLAAEVSPVTTGAVVAALNARARGLWTLFEVMGGRHRH